MLTSFPILFAVTILQVQEAVMQMGFPNTNHNHPIVRQYLLLQSQVLGLRVSYICVLFHCPYRACAAGTCNAPGPAQPWPLFPCIDCSLAGLVHGVFFLVATSSCCKGVSFKCPHLLTDTANVGLFQTKRLSRVSSGQYGYICYIFAVGVYIIILY